MNLAIMNGFSEVVEIFIEYTNIEEYPNTSFSLYKRSNKDTKPCELGSFIHQAVLFSNLNVLKVLFNAYYMKKNKKGRMWTISHSFWENSRIG